MADKRIYDLTTQDTSPDSDAYLVFDKSGYAEAVKVTYADVLQKMPVAPQAVGGNTRGTAAVDLQITRSAGTQVASGNYSAIGGGRNNTANTTDATVSGGYSGTASGTQAVVCGGWGNTASAARAVVSGGANNTASDIDSAVFGGSANTASASYAAVGGGANNTASGINAAVLGGAYAVASKTGQQAHANGQFIAAGDAQRSVYVLRVATVNETPTALGLDGTATGYLTIADDTVWNFRAELVAMTADAAKYAAYTIIGLVKRANGTVAVAGVATTVINESDAGWDATAVADDTNKALTIQVTGAAATSIAWVAAVYTTEVTLSS